MLGYVRLGYVRFAHAHIKPNGRILFAQGAFKDASRFYCPVLKFKY
jgi:hypothetical protein